MLYPCNPDNSSSWVGNMFKFSVLEVLARKQALQPTGDYFGGLFASVFGGTYT